MARFRKMMISLGYVLNRLGLGCILLLSSLVFTTNIYSQEDSSKEPEFSQVIKLELSPNYVSTHQNVYLKDISKCSGGELCFEIYGIRVASFSQNQTSITLDQDSIRSSLTKEYPSVDFRLFGANVKIEARSHPLTQKEVADEFITTLSKKLSRYGSFKVGVDINFIKNVDLFDDEYQIKIEGLDDKNDEQEFLKTCLTKTRFTVFYSSDDIIKEALINARIKLEKKVVLSTHQIPKNTIVTSKDLTTGFVPVSYFSLQAISSYKAVIGKRTKHTIYNNKTFSSKNLIIPSLIDKNQILTLRTKETGNRGLSMSRTVRSLNSGNKGSVINVIPIGDKSSVRNNIIQAKVIDSKTVETL